MSQHDNKILNREFGKFMGKFGVRPNGQLGAGLAALFLPYNELQLSLDVTTNPRFVMKIATDILAKEGELLDPQASSEISEVKALIGSGFFNMNPALVTVQIHQLSSNQTHITIRGVAKEGLIKQRAGEKAARLVAQRLTEAFQ